MAKSRRNRKNRSHRKNSRRNRKMYYGGACSLASAAPVNEQYGAAMMAQSLAQGNQFATMTRPYHGGRRTGCGMIRGGRRAGCGMMPQAGGWADMTAPLAAVQEAVKNVAALAGATTGSASAAPAAEAPAAPAAAAPSASGSAALKGGRRRRNSRKNRKGSRKNRRSSRKMYYGGMAPMSIFGSEGTDVNRASAHLAGQDAALNEALAYSKANPQMGGRRRRRGSRRGMRGGAFLEGAPYTQTSSNMLLADSPAATAQAAKMESPAWTGVQQGTFLG